MITQTEKKEGGRGEKGKGEMGNRGIGKYETG
jgi:hypothetical protein